ncbi:MAG: hypothetical protein EAX86_09240 [Candidatus Heimdallarchaeota archaeon]|nr:hypothetical protein [Candidatus Heimdallarchaeota archaeon]
MNLRKRIFSYDRDLDLAREFLLEVYEELGDLNYLIPTKIENHKFGPCGSIYTTEDDKDILIWELNDHDGVSNIIAVSHRGGAANYHLEILPQFKSLEKQIFLDLEDYERSIRGNSKRIIHYTVETDTDRSKVLEELNYHLVELHEFNYKISLVHSISKVDLPPKFKIYNIKSSKTDINKFQKCLGAIYPHCAEYASIERIQFLHNAEFYHEDLDLAMVSTEGDFISVCQFRLDPYTRIAELELIGTLKEYREHHIEEHLINEGLQRLRKYNPREIYSVEININDEYYNSILQSIGFIITEKLYMWEKPLNKSIS